MAVAMELYEEKRQNISGSFSIAGVRETNERTSPSYVDK
jgi:hypothetical protein